MIAAEVERQWQKRLDQWAKERKARKKLMEEVLAIRRQQVEERREYYSMIGSRGKITRGLRAILPPKCKKEP